MNTATYSCSRCSGAGRINAFGHVLSGICFACAGTGKQKSKPMVSILWAVFGTDRTTGEVARLYNMNAPTEAAAVTKARKTMLNASAAFKDQYTLDGAKAIRAEVIGDSLKLPA